jgi:hypothetical protein
MTEENEPGFELLWEMFNIAPDGQKKEAFLAILDGMVEGGKGVLLEYVAVATPLANLSATLVESHALFKSKTFDYRAYQESLVRVTEAKTALCDALLAANTETGSAEEAAS